MESRADRLNRYAEQIRAHLLAPIPDDPDPPYITEWRIEVGIEPAEVDPETGEEWAPERITARAYDLGHHSNVLFVEITEYGIEVG